MVLEFAVHVDRLLVSAKKTKVVEYFVKGVSGLFACKDLKEASYYTGYHFSCDRERRELRIYQHLYINTIVDRSDINTMSLLPTLTDTSLSKEDTPSHQKSCRKCGAFRSEKQGGP